MSTKIRLARGGTKKRPYYRIVVAASRAARDGNFIEKIGSYNPLLNDDSEQRVVLDAERAKHWLSVGAQPTSRVQHFLFKAGLVDKPPAQKPARKAKNDKGGNESAAAPTPAPAAPAPAAPAEDSGAAA